MPLYCYTLDDESETIEEFFPMGKAPDYIEKMRRDKIDGFKQYVFYRDLAAEWKGGPISGNKGEWPIVSYAVGVHADQAQELRDHYKKHGCPTEVTSDGDPVFRDPQHMKRALKCRGQHDRASYGT